MKACNQSISHSFALRLAFFKAPRFLFYFYSKDDGFERTCVILMRFSSRCGNAGFTGHQRGKAADEFSNPDFFSSPFSSSYFPHTITLFQLGQILHTVHFKTNHGIGTHELNFQSLFRMSVDVSPIICIGYWYDVRNTVGIAADTADHFIVKQRFNLIRR